jgi:hypothetical protein
MLVHAGISLGYTPRRVFHIRKMVAVYAGNSVVLDTRSRFGTGTITVVERRRDEKGFAGQVVEDR